MATVKPRNFSTASGMMIRCEVRARNGGDALVMETNERGAGGAKEASLLPTTG